MSKLQELRRESGRLQADIAEEAGISREYLSSLENGRNGLTRELAEKLARIYGVSPVEVLEYALPESDRRLKDDWEAARSRIERLKQDHARELQSKQLEIDSLKALLEQSRSSNTFAQSMCEQLLKQNEALSRRVEELESRPVISDAVIKTGADTLPAGENV